MQVVSSGQEAAQLKSLQDKVQLDCCMALFLVHALLWAGQHRRSLQAAGRHEEKQKQLRSRNAEIVRENTACVAGMT